MRAGRQPGDPGRPGVITAHQPQPACGEQVRALLHGRVQQLLPGGGLVRACRAIGWGPTFRLCLILAVRWGVPLSGGVKLASLLLSHVH